LKKIFAGIKDKAKKSTRKTTASVKDAATIVNSNKTKYILIVVSAIIIPAGIILGPIALAREIKKDREKQPKGD
jgi:hypothetical protein